MPDYITLRTIVHCEPLELRRLLSVTAGVLDPTFGKNGIADVPPTTGEQIYDGPGLDVVAEALQPDGKIVAGLEFSAHDTLEIQVMRLNPSGSPDKTFGKGGLTPLLEFQPTPAFEVLSAVAVLPGGQILVAGGPTNTPFNSQMDFIRLNANGSVAATWSFNGNGFWDFSAVNALAVQPDGMVIAAGQIAHTDGNGAVLSGGDAAIRFNPLTFQIDKSFGSSGIAFLPSTDPSGVTSLAFQGNQIVLADFDNLFRLRHDGSLDTGFGVNGIASIDTSFNITKVAVQHDGSVIAAGQLLENLMVAHLSANGVFDKSFANGKGLATIAGSAFLSRPSLASQADGKILVAGDNNDASFELTRLNANGSPDADFGPQGNGHVILSAGGAPGFGGAVLTDIEGRILVGGAANGDAVVARLLPGPSTATASVSGNVFNDLLGGGVMRPGDPGLPGWTVALDVKVNGGWQPLFATATDAAGNYTFPALAAGDYRVREVIPSGWRTSLYTSASRAIALTPAQHVTGVNFANTRRAAVLGRVFADTNGNGKQDPGETGLAGWRVYVDLNNDGLFDDGDRSVLTDANGDFALAAFRPGTYAIRMVPRPGFHLTAPIAGSFKVTLTSGELLSTRLTFALSVNS